MILGCFKVFFLNKGFGNWEDPPPPPLWEKFPKSPVFFGQRPKSFVLSVSFSVFLVLGFGIQNFCPSKRNDKYEICPCRWGPVCDTTHICRNRRNQRHCTFFFKPTDFFLWITQKGTAFSKYYSKNINANPHTLVMLHLMLQIHHPKY